MTLDDLIRTSLQKAAEEQKMTGEQSAEFLKRILDAFRQNQSENN